MRWAGEGERLDVDLKPASLIAELARALDNGCQWASLDQGRVPVDADPHSIRVVFAELLSVEKSFETMRRQRAPVLYSFGSCREPCDAVGCGSKVASRRLLRGTRVRGWAGVLTRVKIRWDDGPTPARQEQTKSLRTLGD